MEKREINGISINFIRSVRARRITIKILAEGEVKVTLPKSASVKTGEEFVKKNMPWLKQNLEKVKDKIDNRKVFDEESEIKTFFRTVTIERHNENKVHAEVYKSYAKIYFPARVDITRENSQEAIKNIIIEIYRSEAKKYLPERLSMLANKYGFTFNKVTVKNIVSRWGSCSGKNNINLSIHLMRLPEEMIDYVILHELCHTIEKNHSKAFWLQVARVCPNYKVLDRGLKDYNPRTIG